MNSKSTHCTSTHHFNHIEHCFCTLVEKLMPCSFHLLSMDAFTARILIPLQTSWTWIDNGVCDNSLLICNNFSGSQNNLLQIRGFNFASGQNDPVHIKTTFMCENCPACVLQVEVVNNTILETMNFTCDGSAQTNVLTQNVEFDTVQYSVIFGSGVTGTQCVTIESYRIWQYEDCPAQVFQLANYPPTNPGIGPVDSTGCVENAESSGTSRAGCSDMSVWEMAPDTTPCTCSAGYESNGDLTACEGQYC